MLGPFVKIIVKPVIADATTTEVKAAVSPLAAEAARALSSPGTAAISTRPTLSLKFPPADSILAPDSVGGPTANRLSTSEKIQVQKPGSHGRATNVVEVERKVSRGSDKGPRPPARANDAVISDGEAGRFIDNVVTKQDAILKHNLSVAQKDPDAMGKYAQLHIFEAVKKQFDKVNKNPDLVLVCSADGSPADMVGCDFALFNKATNKYATIDVKPLFDQSKIVSSARAQLLEYQGDWFTHTPHGFKHNPQDHQFKTFIEKSANKLVSLGENLPFDMTKHPMPSFTPGVSRLQAHSEISLFRESLLKNGDYHQRQYGDDLHRALRYLERT